MEKYEFVQNFIIQNPEETVENAIKVFNSIEKAFEVTPTKDLWDYNDRN